MSVEEQIRTCAHAGCPCPADPGSDYRSPSCESAKNARNIKCSCYHELCEEGRQTTRIGSPSGSYDPTMTQHDRQKPLLADWSKGDKAGAAVYALRKTIVEPVFGQIKQARGFRRFLLRGLEKVRGEWALICMTHNLLKLHKICYG
jgi:Transposase DDE domain